MIKAKLGRRKMRNRCGTVILGSVGALGTTAVLAGPPLLGERSAIENHLGGTGLGENLADLFKHGQLLMSANFNALDGQGRPASTGTGSPRRPDEPAFIRTSGPDANSCAGCHAQPRPGGAGDIVANVFVLAQASTR